jgi:hypothetical protein
VEHDLVVVERLEVVVATPGTLNAAIARSASAIISSRVMRAPCPGGWNVFAAFFAEPG